MSDHINEAKAKFMEGLQARAKPAAVSENFLRSGAKLVKNVGKGIVSGATKGGSAGSHAGAVTGAYMGASTLDAAKSGSFTGLVGHVGKGTAVGGLVGGALGAQIGGAVGGYKAARKHFRGKTPKPKIRKKPK